MDLDGLGIAMLASAAVVLVAVVGVRVAGRVGVPGLLLYLALGLAIGQFVPGVDFSDAQLATVLGYAALVIILAEGGLTTSIKDLRPVLWPSLMLATVGVAVSIGVVAGALLLVTDLPVRVALLIGAVLAATDAAAVFTVLRGLRLHPRLRSLLEGEAGFNDAPVVVLVVLLSTSDITAESFWQIPLLVIAEIAGGAVIGFGVGYGAQWLLPRLALPAVGLYPIAVMSLMALAYGGAAVIHASGFMAVYVAAVLVGSADELPHRRSVIGFAEGLAWAAQIGLFIMLGLLATPDQLSEALIPAAVAGVALVVLARPLATLVSLAPFRLPANWLAFVSMAGLRGAVPIVFAAIPLGYAVPEAHIVFDATLILVVILTLIQTPLLPAAGKRLRVDVGWKAQELQVEAAPMDRMDASLLGVDIEEGSRISGLYVADLRLPEGAAVSLVVRDGVGFVPDATTRFRPGDQLLVVASNDARRAAVKRLRLVSRDGRLAGWRHHD